MAGDSQGYFSFFVGNFSTLLAHCRAFYVRSLGQRVRFLFNFLLLTNLNCVDIIYINSTCIESQEIESLRHEYATKGGQDGKGKCEETL